MFDRVSVHGDLRDRLRIDVRFQFFSDGTDQDYETRYLDTATRASGTGSDKHQNDQDDPAGLRPLVKVGRCKSRGRYDRSDLKSGVADRGADT